LCSRFQGDAAQELIELSLHKHPVRLDLVEDLALRVGVDVHEASRAIQGKVEGMILTEESDGARPAGRTRRPFCCTPWVSSKRRWHLMSRPPDPQQGS
jgi:hypothetical protein